MAISTISSAGIATSGIARTNMYAGAVLQVVSVALTSEFSWSTKGSWVDMTGISASITPTSSTSKIFVMVMLSTGDGGNNYLRSYRVSRGGTPIVQGPSVANAYQSALGSLQGAVGNDAMGTYPYMYLDSPASASSLTYQLQGYASPSSVTTSYINRPYVPNSSTNSPTGVSTITLMEIAA